MPVFWCVQFWAMISLGTPYAMNATQAAVLIQLKQAARCGLRSELTVPALLGALDRLIPSDNAAFGWMAPDGRLSHLYIDKPLGLAGIGRLAEEAFRRPGNAGIPAVSESPDGGSTLDVIPVQSGFADSESHRSLFEPHGIREILRCAIGPPGAARAALCLFRSARRARFSEDERRRIKEILTWFEAALQGRRIPQRWEAADRDGYLVADESGRLLHTSARGRHEWRLAINDLMPGAAPKLAPPVSLGALLQRLSAPRWGGEPPPFEVDNHWGRFILRSAWLDESQAGDERRMLVRIVRHVPAEIKTIERLADLPLSCRQKELCCLLARGLSYPEAAEFMGVRRSTITDYVNVIFKRLEINTREDLLAKLAGDQAF